MGPRLPLASILALIRGRGAWGDVGDALFSPVPTSPPDGEYTPGAVPQTPQEHLELWCEQNGVELRDFRDLRLWPRNEVYDTSVYGWPRNKKRGQPYGSRPWEQCTCFMLHTTAVGGMDKNRGLGIPAHLYVPKEPAIVLLHQMERLVAHGHAGNRYCVGCEISGKSDWDTEDQIGRVRALIRYFQACRYRHVGPHVPNYICAHRQTHRTRVNDPGARIWRDCGEWAIEELNFKLGPVVGSGHALDEPPDPWIIRAS